MTGPNEHGDNNNGGRAPSKNEESKEEEGAVIKNADGADSVEDVEDPKNKTGGAFASGLPNQDDDDDDQSKQQKKKKRTKVAADAPWSARMWEVFTTFWPLGFVAFGGPQAHVAIMRDRLVDQRDWLDEEAFTELFAIGQGLPGPTSTQLVISAALTRAGPLGGLLAFMLWNMPGLVVLTVCGRLITTFVPNDGEAPFYLAGLPPAAISLVFKAFYGFAVNLDPLGVVLALASCLTAILLNNDARIKSSSSQWVFPTTLALGGIITWLDSRRKTPLGSYKAPNIGWEKESDETMRRIGIPLWMGALLFLVWLAVLVVVVVLNNRTDIDNNNKYLEIFALMYRIGSIIFGGGQVVLPLLQDEVVHDNASSNNGTDPTLRWMTKDQFLQGLGLAQSMPGPLFNFSAYLGAVYAGVPGALVAFIGLFGPGVVLIFAAVPYWARLRHNRTFKSLLSGVNATAIGLVGAACVTLWEAAIEDAADAMVFCIAFTLAVVFSVEAPICIIVGGIVGAILHRDALNLGQQPYCIDQGFGERQ